MGAARKQGKDMSMGIFILVMLATGALAMVTQAYVRSSFNRYSRVGSSSGYSGAEVAAEILRRNGIFDVTIHEHQSFLVYHGRSLSALGVAAHEAGHAIQHKNAYAPLHLRMAAVGLTNFANTTISWLFMFGMVSGFLSTYLGLGLMALCWAIIMGFNLITLPVEYDASRRAKDMLARLGFVRTQEEAGGVAKVLNAAALTYLAAFVTSLVYFLLYALPLFMGGRRD
jgi:Zn-dependent membrane protease YugP